MKIEIEETIDLDFRNLGKDIDIQPVMRYALKQKDLKFRKYYAVEVFYFGKHGEETKRFLLFKHKLIRFKISEWPSVLRFPSSKKRMTVNILKKFNQKNLEKGIKIYDKGVKDFSKAVSEIGKSVGPQTSNKHSKFKFGISQKEYDEVFGWK